MPNRIYVGADAGKYLVKFFDQDMQQDQDLDLLYRNKTGATVEREESLHHDLFIGLTEKNHNISSPVGSERIKGAGDEPIGYYMPFENKAQADEYLTKVFGDKLGEIQQLALHEAPDYEAAAAESPHSRDLLGRTDHVASSTGPLHGASRFPRPRSGPILPDVDATTLRPGAPDSGSYGTRMVDTSENLQGKFIVCLQSRKTGFLRGEDANDNCFIGKDDDRKDIMVAKIEKNAAGHDVIQVPKTMHEEKVFQALKTQFLSFIVDNVADLDAAKKLVLAYGADNLKFNETPPEGKCDKAILDQLHQWAIDESPEKKPINRLAASASRTGPSI